MENQTTELLRYFVRRTRKDGSIAPYLIYDGATFTKGMADATCESCNRQWGSEITFEVVTAEK